MTEKQNAPQITVQQRNILPFTIDREQAAGIFLRTFASDKMTPTEFTEAVHHDRFSLKYFPAYLFSCDVLTKAQADCTLRSNDSVIEYRSERTVKTHFSDILLNAGKSADDMLLSLLEPYRLDEETKFSTENVNDEIDIEEADLDPAEVFGSFRPELEKLAKTAVETSFGKFTDKKITGCTHSTDNICADLVYLPVWVLECDYGGRPYKIFLNGQTGRVAGIPPRSFKKAAAVIGSAAVVGSAAAQLIWMAVNAIW